MKLVNCLLLGILVFVSGCAVTVGNLVTDVSSDQEGNVIVEKCIIERNGWTNTFDYKNCQTKTIKNGGSKSK